MVYNVKIIWDSEADRWRIESSDIPGLVMESGSLDALQQRIRDIAPELIAFNCNYSGIFKLSITVERTDQFNIPLEMVS